MAKKVRLKGLIGVVQGAHGTAGSPTTADGIQIEEDIWGDIEVDYLEENLRDQMAQAGMGRAGVAKPGGRFCRFRVAVAVKGSGASGTVPELDALLRCSGHGTTGSGGTTTYAPISSGFEYGTFWAYSSGQVFKVQDCVAALDEIVGVPGQIAVARFTVQGILVEDPSDASLPAITYPAKAVSPPTFGGVGFSMNGVDPDVESITFRQNLEVSPRPRANATDGHAGFEVVDWNPDVQAALEMPALATLDPYGLHKAGTLFAWDIPIGTGGSHNLVTISGSKGRISQRPAHSEGDGFAMVDVTFRCQNDDEESADTAYSIAFGA